MDQFSQKRTESDHSPKIRQECYTKYCILTLEKMPRPFTGGSGKHRKKEGFKNNNRAMWLMMTKSIQVSF